MIFFISDFRKAFQLFDKDGNGKITADELFDVMRSLGQKPSDSEVEAMIQQADQDGNQSDLKTFIWSGGGVGRFGSLVVLDRELGKPTSLPVEKSIMMFSGMCIL